MRSVTRGRQSSFTYGLLVPPNKPSGRTRQGVPLNSNVLPKDDEAIRDSLCHDCAHLRTSTEGKLCALDHCNRGDNVSWRTTRVVHDPLVRRRTEAHWRDSQ